MANKKDLRGGIEKMREVAQLLNEWADDMESSLIKKSGRKAAADIAPAEAPAAADEPAADEAAVVRKKPEIPAPETVREILGKKCAAGYRAQVQALINSFGAMKFSEVDPAHYPALLEAVESLGGDPDAG